MNRTSHRLSAVAALGLALALAVSGCSSDQDSPAAASDQGVGSADRDVTVIEPGRPGEPATTVEPGDVPAGDEFNEADVAFVQMMIPHHAQALTMCRLAARRAQDDRVLSLARRIRGAQGPEIVAMSAWLDARHIDVPKAGEDPSAYDHGAHGHGSMMGMLTDEEMGALAAAKGPRFDRLFLKSMIGHHQGAVAMAQDAARDGADVRAAEMASDVVAGQSAEIQRMRELLRQL